MGSAWRLREGRGISGREGHSDQGAGPCGFCGSLFPNLSLETHGLEGHVRDRRCLSVLHFPFPSWPQDSASRRENHPLYRPPASLLVIPTAPRRRRFSSPDSRRTASRLMMLCEDASHPGESKLPGWPFPWRQSTQSGLSSGRWVSHTLSGCSEPLGGGHSEQMPVLPRHRGGLGVPPARVSVTASLQRRLRKFHTQKPSPARKKLRQGHACQSRSPR